MYKHKILESLIFIEKNINDKFNIKPLYQEAIRQLKLATEIFVGKADKYDRVIKQKTGVKIEDTQLKLPFEIVIFTGDYTGYNTIDDGEIYAPMQSILAYDIGDNVVCVIMIAFNSESKMWEILPTIAGVSQTEINLYPLSNEFGNSEFYIKMRDKFHKDAVAAVAELITYCDICNCKNVSITNISQPEKLNKKRLKTGKLPIFEYKILTIDPNKGRELAGKTINNKLQAMPLHLCRGHFKEYTTEKPLFGRITGRFWWQPFARGNVKNGVRDKDYIIKH